MEIKLKPVSRNDAELIFESWGKNHENFLFLSTKPQKSIEDTQAYIDTITADIDAPCFHITDAQTGAVLGLIKAKIEQHKALVGYVVDYRFWGKGVATQATRAMLDILKERPTIKRIWATCAIDNYGSSRVLEKCGFIREGVLRNWIVYPLQGNEPQDNFSYYYDKNSHESS